MTNWFSYINSPQLQHQVLGLKIFAFLLSAFFVGTIIYFSIKTNYLKYRIRKQQWAKDYREFKAVRPKKRSKEWDNIARLIQSDLLSENKLAVVKAMQLLDKVLKEIGYPKGTWQERLSQGIAEDNVNLSPVLEACQVSENILKDPNRPIEKEELKKAVVHFQETLKQLNYF